MSHPSRPQARGPASRRRRELKIEGFLPLEERCLLAPVLSPSPRGAAFTAAATPPAGTTLGAVSVTLGAADPGFLTAAPFTSVTQLTPISAFGGDIVRIRSGPGGDFGKGVYAISRGAGANGIAPGSDLNPNTTPAVTGGVAANRPGVIYRVDPATGKSSVFFDLNTVVNQLEKGANASNSAGTATGLVNWYDMTFDPEGYFDGRPSMFVSSVDRADPNKNAVYRIGPDGSFLGVFLQFSAGQSALKLNANPSAILVPPPEDQTFLRGLFAGGGNGSAVGNLTAVFFDANAFNPSRGSIGSNSLPKGASETGLTLGPITALTAANVDYPSRVYSTFTDFGTPAAGGIPATPGFSGVQGLNGEFLIRNTAGGFINNASTDSTLGDRQSILSSEFRRFEDIAFDQYGYFAQGANIGTGTGTTTNGTGSVGGTAAGGGSGAGLGTAGTGTSPSLFTTTIVGRPAISLPPANAGNLFVADLGTGLSVPVAVPTPVAGQPAAVRVPVQGPELVQVTNLNGVISTSVTPVGAGLGGRIVRITPSGVVRNFAENFHTSNNTDASGFQFSSLSITFSADGTTMYAADDDGIWQFKTVASLAGSTTGSLIGLNDLRSLGVPYEGQDSAVAILDTGVDALSSPFRGRVSTGTNIFTNGFGNDDTASGANGVIGGTGTGTGGTAGGGLGGGGAAGNPAPPTTVDGHGTPIAGVVAQFVPQATLVPVNIFAPFLAFSTAQASLTGGGGTGNGAGGGGNNAVLIAANSNAFTTSQNLYKGLEYVTKHPFANDPVRPGKTDRVIATTMAFGSTETFDSEGVAYRRYPQIVIAFKNQLRKFRKLGIAPIAAAGQFGAPFASGQGANGATGGTAAGAGGGGGNNGVAGTNGNNNAENGAVGDNNGMSLPGILNEVVSVSGSYPFPFSTGPSTLPTNPPVGVIPRPSGPVLVFGNFTSIGGLAAGGTGTTGTGGGTTTTAGNLAGLLTNADFAQYTDRLLGAANRNITTDYVAPALDVPTFRRTFALSTAAGTTGTGTGQGGAGTGGTTTGTATTAGDPGNHNTFAIAGTSVSAAEVTGAFALVSSALNYWANLNHTGVTADAYLTQPVGAHVLNFGPHAFKDMTAFNNPDGINSILQWTAVPANDPSDGLSASTPLTASGNTDFRNYSRLSVGNAIAAIEGEIAMQYLLDHDDFKYIDTNNNGIVTAQELQDFVDSAPQKGLAEAGAMARLLGGTARPSAFADTSNPYGYNPNFTQFFEQPDQPDVLQRRFNFFDFAADGNLNGSITIDQIKVEAHNLLPKPDDFVINDRQRSSVDNYLLAPTAQRNYHDLIHISPKYQFVPKSAVAKFRGISPAQFGVGKGQSPRNGLFPVYTLYEGNKATATKANLPSTARTTTTAVNGGTANGSTDGTKATATTTVVTPGTTGATAPTTNQAAATPTATPAATPATTATTVQGNTTSGGMGAQAALATLTAAVDNANGTAAPATTSTPAAATSSSTGTSASVSASNGTATPTSTSTSLLGQATPITPATPAVVTPTPAVNQAPQVVQTSTAAASAPKQVAPKPQKKWYQKLF